MDDPDIYTCAEATKAVKKALGIPNYSLVDKSRGPDYIGIDNDYYHDRCCGHCAEINFIKKHIYGEDLFDLIDSESERRKKRRDYGKKYDEEKKENLRREIDKFKQMILDSDLKPPYFTVSDLMPREDVDRLWKLRIDPFDVMDRARAEIQHPEEQGNFDSADQNIKARTIQIKRTMLDMMPPYMKGLIKDVPFRSMQKRRVPRKMSNAAAWYDTSSRQMFFVRENALRLPEDNLVATAVHEGWHAVYASDDPRVEKIMDRALKTLQEKSKTSKKIQTGVLDKILMHVGVESFETRTGMKHDLKERLDDKSGFTKKACQAIMNDDFLSHRALDEITATILPEELMGKHVSYLDGSVTDGRSNFWGSRSWDFIRDAIKEIG